MGDEHGISWPDGGMVASDSGMSFHCCTKRDYHYLNKENKELRNRNKELRARNAELEAEVERLRKALDNILENSESYMTVEILAQQALEASDG